MENSGAHTWPSARATVSNHRYLIACTILSIALHYAILSAFRGSLHDAAWHPVDSGLAWLTVTMRPPPKVEPERSPAGATILPAATKKPIENSSRNPVVRHLPVASAGTVPPAAATTSPAETAADNPPRTIDFDAAREIARDAARTRNGVLAKELPPNLEPKKPEYESPLAQAIAKSARPDCKTKYAEMGFFAIPFLLRDTVTDSGCKW